MGTTTPNMSIYKPSSGEDLYNDSYKIGMDNIDAHDHSGAPNNGVQIGTNGIQDGAITPEKLSQDIFRENTIQTTDATPTEIASIDVDESSSVTIEGRFVGLRDDATEAVGGNFMATFYRPTGSDVAYVGVPMVNINYIAASSLNFQVVPDVPNEAISLRCVGEAAKVFDWKVVFSVLSQP